jgi:hypothetical protein
VIAGVSQVATPQEVQRMVSHYLTQIPKRRLMDEIDCTLLGTDRFKNYVCNVLGAVNNYFTLPDPGTTVPKSVAMIVEMLLNDKFVVGKQAVFDLVPPGYGLLNAHTKNVHLLELESMPMASLDHVHPKTSGPEDYGAATDDYGYPLGYVPVCSPPRGDFVRSHACRRMYFSMTNMNPLTFSYLGLFATPPRLNMGPTPPPESLEFSTGGAHAHGHVQDPFSTPVRRRTNGIPTEQPRTPQAPAQTQVRTPKSTEHNNPHIPGPFQIQAYRRYETVTDKMREDPFAQDIHDLYVQFVVARPLTFSCCNSQWDVNGPGNMNPLAATISPMNKVLNMHAYHLHQHKYDPQYLRVSMDAFKSTDALVEALNVAIHSTEDIGAQRDAVKRETMRQENDERQKHLRAILGSRRSAEEKLQMALTSTRERIEQNDLPRAPPSHLSHANADVCSFCTEPIDHAIWVPLTGCGHLVHLTCILQCFSHIVGQNQHPDRPPCLVTPDSKPRGVPPCNTCRLPFFGLDISALNKNDFVWRLPFYVPGYPDLDLQRACLREEMKKYSMYQDAQNPGEPVSFERMQQIYTEELKLHARGKHWNHAIQRFAQVPAGCSCNPTCHHAPTLATPQ